MPSGPIEPATIGAPASRASATPATHNSANRSASPCRSRRYRFAPNVFVRTRRAPAPTNDAWISATRVGARTFSSSMHASTGTPRAISDVPMPPSARSGASASRDRNTAASIRAVSHPSRRSLPSPVHSSLPTVTWVASPSTYDGRSFGSAGRSHPDVVRTLGPGYPTHVRGDPRTGQRSLGGR